MPFDFSRQNLQGRSFKGQNLTGANFAYADIRGANFTDTVLTNTDFRYAKAGLQLRSTIALLIISLLLSATSALTLTKAVDIAATNENWYKAGAAALTWIGVGIVAIAGIIALSLAYTLANVVGVPRGLSLIIFSTVASFGAIYGIGSLNIGVIGLGIALVLFLTAYISWQTLTGNEKYEGIRKIAIAFGATGGTSFFGADLTDADFTGAILRNTDFRKANLTRTRFFETQKLNLSRLGDSILAQRHILNLLVSCYGRNKSYIRANLKGANLKDADLQDANFKDADIRDATFQGACLARANLTLAQAIDTDFTNTEMTGACIESWNIGTTTKLDYVDCRYIYILEGYRERRPSSGEFQPGEFSNLFKEALNTVDFIFRNGIDWKAFATAFQKLYIEQEDTELSIQSIEKKGDGVVVVRVNTLSELDRSKIADQFMKNYELAKKAIEEKYQELLKAKEEEIEIYRQQNNFLNNFLDKNLIMPSSDQENNK